MKWRTTLLLLLLLLALVSPLWLRDPAGRPIMSVDDWLETPDWVTSLVTAAREIMDSPVPPTDSGALPGDDSRFAPGDSYFRWQDETGVWHFSDQAPAHLAERLQPQPLPEPANRIGAPPKPAKSEGEGSASGIVPGFNSSMGAPLPADVSREAIETLLEEAHENRMGDER